MNIPTSMPSLSAGAHAPGDGRACVMEYVALLAGESWTDSPACTHPVLAKMAQGVNDRLPDSERHRLVSLIGRLFGTAEVGTDHERQVVSVRLAVWAGRQVLHLARKQDRKAVGRALDVAEAWSLGNASKAEVQDAAANAANAANAAYAAHAAYAAANAAHANAAYAAHAAYAAAAAYAAHANAAYAAHAAYAAAAAAAAAANAAYAAHAAAAANAAAAAANAAYAAHANAAADDLVGLLTGLLDEYDRITGRTVYRVITNADLADLAAAI